MNAKELQDATERIVNDPNTTEITYRKKVIDEFGSQTLIIKREYVLGNECIEEIPTYEGNTTNFKNVGHNRTLKVDAVQVLVEPDIIHTEEVVFEDIQLGFEPLVFEERLDEPVEISDSFNEMQKQIEFLKRTRG